MTTTDWPLIWAGLTVILVAVAFMFGYWKGYDDTKGNWAEGWDGGRNFGEQIGWSKGYKQGYMRGIETWQMVVRTKKKAVEEQHGEKSAEDADGAAAAEDLPDDRAAKPGHTVPDERI